MRAYIFHHILSGGKPLEGEALVDEIVVTAGALPGYQEWCRHQHEIEQRAAEWARCIENSHYFHFGDPAKKNQPDRQDPALQDALDHAPSWNQRQSAATRDRIRRAIADLLETNTLPARPTARFQALLKYGLGGASLYRHRDLWHPTYFDINSNQNTASEGALPVENPPHPPNHNPNSQLDGVESASNWLSSPSLFSTTGGDNRLGQTSSDLFPTITTPEPGNSLAPADAPPANAQAFQEGPYVQQTLFQLSASQEAFQEAARMARANHQRIAAEAAEKRHVDRMQQFLDSGDPILVAEAMAWAQVNPGVLQLNLLQWSILTRTLNQPPTTTASANENQPPFRGEEDKNGPSV